MRLPENYMSKRSFSRMNQNGTPTPQGKNEQQNWHEDQTDEQA